MELDKEGTLKDFFRCYTSDNLGLNILSLAQVWDNYKVWWEQGKEFIVHLPGLKERIICSLLA